MALVVSAYFTDDTGGFVEERNIVDRPFVKSNAEFPLHVTATNKKSKTMRVQIRPAD